MPKGRRNAVDFEVGRRIRVQRLHAGLSQTALADQIGVTFQQVQKYEQGANRVGAGRLTAIAAALKIPISTFFDGTQNVTASKGPTPAELLMLPYALRLVKGFAKIKNSKIQLSIVELVEKVSADR